MGPGKVVGLPGGKSTLAGAYTAFVQILLWEGDALNPGTGPGEQGLSFSPNPSFWLDALMQ